MLLIRNLEKHYKSKKGLDHHALKNINLEFGDKGFVFCLGKSGSGKSTLLNILGGLDTFDSGDIEIKGKSSKDFKAKDWDSYRNTYVGFVFQEFNIIENYSIFKNIGLALELQGVHKKDIQKHVEGILKTVDLEGYGRRKPNELSGGQKQRIAIARALVKSPEIILADEPTGNLDSITGRQIMDTLKELSKDKLVIMVSHDREYAEKYGDRIIELKDGFVERDMVSVEGKFIDKPSLLNVSTISPKKAVYVPNGEKLDSSHLESINEALSGGNILYIPVSKKQLTEKDLIKINHLLNGEDTVMPIISSKETNDLKDNMTFRVDSTLETLDRFKTKSGSSFKLIKSVLPIGNSIKMALVSVWRKKFKLVFSILLFLAAVGLFGFSETVTKFDIADATAETYNEAGIEFISLSNTNEILGWDSPEESIVPFSTPIVERFMSDFDYDYSLLYGFAKRGVTINTPTEFVEVSRLTGFFVVNDLSDFNLSIIVGTLPVTSKDIMLTDFVLDYYIEEGTYQTYSSIIGEPFEIEGNLYNVTGVINTDYETHLYLNDIPQSQYEDNISAIGKYQNNVNTIYSRVFVNELFYPEYENTFDGFSNYYTFQTPRLNSKDVWDTSYLSNEAFKYNNSLSESDFADQYLFIPNGFTSLRQNEIIISVESIAQLFEISDSEVIRELINDTREAGESVYDVLLEKGYLNIERQVSVVLEGNWERVAENTYKIVGVIDFGYYYQIQSIEEMLEFLEENEVDLNKYNIDLEESISNPWNLQGQLVGAYVETKLAALNVEVISDQDYWNYVLHQELNESNLDFFSFEEFSAEMLILGTAIRAFENGEEVEIDEQTEAFFNRGFYINIDDDEEFLDEQIVGYYDQYIYDLANENDINPNADYYGYIQDLAKENLITLPNQQPDMYNPIIFNEFEYNTLNPYQTSKAELIVVKLKDLESNKKFFATTELQGYNQQTASGTILQLFATFRDDAAGIFRYVSIGLAAFAAILMFTNISSSVLASKKEIGTLRAIGAKGSDVAKIFVIEALIIGGFTTFLAIIALQIGTVQLNNILTEQIGINISIFNSSLVVALEMVGLSLIVVLVAAFLPVKGVTIMKPINAIKNK